MYFYRLANTLGIDRIRWTADPLAAPALTLYLTGLGARLTDAAGRYRFVTVKPGPVPHPDGGMQAPHIDVSVFARGLLP